MDAIHIIKGDITKQKTDIIVNAANSHLQHGGGVAQAIANAAGSELIKESEKHKFVPTGSVATTTAGNLEAKYVIHAVGPVWKGGDDNEAENLQSCIRKSLEETDRLGLSSISFPAISTGIFGYPLKKAAEVMLQEVIRYTSEENTNISKIQFVLFSDSDYKTFNSVFENLSQTSE